MGDKDGLLTIDQIRADLVPAFKLEMKGLLGEWEASRKPAAPVLSLKQGDEPSLFPLTLDVKIDGRPVKAQLLDPKTGTYMAQASMSGGIAGLVEQGDNFRILNVSLPIVSAGVGVFTGMVIGNIIDVVVPPADLKTDMTKGLMNIGAQGVAAWALLKYGSGFIGGTAAKIGAAVIIFRVLARVLPIQAWVDSLTGMVTGFLPGGPAMKQIGAGQGSYMLQPGSGVQNLVYEGTI